MLFPKTFHILTYMYRIPLNHNIVLYDLCHFTHHADDLSQEEGTPSYFETSPNVEDCDSYQGMVGDFSENCEINPKDQKQYQNSISV